MIKHTQKIEVILSVIMILTIMLSSIIGVNATDYNVMDNTIKYNSMNIKDTDKDTDNIKRGDLEKKEKSNDDDYYANEKEKEINADSQYDKVKNNINIKQKKENNKYKELDNLIAKLPNPSEVNNYNIDETKKLIKEVNEITTKMTFEEIEKYNISKVFGVIEKILNIDKTETGNIRMSRKSIKLSSLSQKSANASSYIQGTVISVNNLAYQKDVWGKFDVRPDDNSTVIHGICGARNQHGHADPGNRISLEKYPQNSDLTKLCYLASKKENNMNYLYLASCAASYINGLSPEYINKVPNSKALLNEAKKINKVPDNFQAYGGMPSNGSQWIVGWRFQPKGKICINKRSKNSKESFDFQCANNYMLKGAEYVIYSDQNLTNEICRLKTDNNGNSEIKEIDVGTYYIKEIKPSRGYYFDSTYEKPEKIEVKENELTTYMSYEPPVASETPVNIIKIDKSNPGSIVNTEGAEYLYNYYDVDPNEYKTVKSLEKIKPSRQWTFRTILEPDADPKKAKMGYKQSVARFDEKHFVKGDDFYKNEEKIIIPLGVFTIKEQEAPKGFTRDPYIYYGNVKQDDKYNAVQFIEEKKDSTLSEDTGLTHIEIPQHIELQIIKENAEHLPEGAINHGSLQGAEYEIYVDDPLQIEEPKGKTLVGKVTTGIDGKAVISKDLQGNDLKPGRYYIKEVKASPGFTLDKGTKKGFRSIECNVTSKNQEIFRYSIKSPEIPRHTIIHKTDITNGINELAGARLQILDKNNNIIEDWISTNKPHEIIGLPDGDYILREIESPFGYDNADEEEFSVKGNEIEQHLKIDNKPIDLKTSAMSKSTLSHTGIISNKELIVDRVVCKNLHVGREYKLKGVLMNKGTGDEYLDSDGNRITAEKTFIAKNANTFVDMEFAIDTSKIKRGTSLVAFEYLYRNDNLIAIHTDINDKSQGITFANISTKAGGKNKSHEIDGTKSTIVIDEVAYSGLSMLEEYVLIGEIFDKKTGKSTGIVTRKIFKPESETGTVEVEFQFDSQKYNEELVVFEELYVNDKLVVEHKDINDLSQTVKINKTPKTGDRNIVYSFMGLIVSLVTVMLYNLKNRFKSA